MFHDTQTRESSSPACRSGRRHAAAATPASPPKPAQPIHGCGRQAGQHGGRALPLPAQAINTPGPAATVSSLPGRRCRRPPPHPPADRRQALPGAGARRASWATTKRSLPAVRRRSPHEAGQAAGTQLRKVQSLRQRALTRGKWAVAGARCRRNCFARTVAGFSPRTPGDQGPQHRVREAARGWR